MYSGIALITYQGYDVAQKITVSVKVSTQLAQSQLSRSWLRLKVTVEKVEILLS